VLALASAAQATVFINEVFINPAPGSDDNNYEFIELLGTPGMKLDGYAIAVFNGTQEKYYDANVDPPPPILTPEIDEFFSLDGQTLGDNGLLVLVMRTPTTSYPYYYPEMLTDSHWVVRANLWNGGLDVPGTVNNDGSTTITLVRNRPGRTQSDPCDPNGLLWGKSIKHDNEYFSLGGGLYQWGNGNLDRGEPNGLGGYTLEMTGLSTLSYLGDDLEIIDEVSVEDGQGWEHDTDERHVDEGSSFGGLPHRHVHAMDDPANFNPDAISRVDYRTKGAGWTPAPDATGEMANGNNWQDTATEQWVRGESIRSGVSPYPFFYDNTPNSIPDAVQPYDTHVPSWLYDGNVPDYNFAAAKTYQIAAGRTNSLAVPFIPGDCDRDGLCDANDISKIAAVFGDDNWIFSNCADDAPETASGDPATQTKPWDLDATGDNGIEASDFQWVLNFQGDTTGHIVGIQYDSNVPAASGVFLNSNSAVECNVTTDVNLPSGRTLTTLHVGDTIEVTVSAQLIAGANTTTGQQNGIMQYIHDAVISSPAVLKVNSVEPLGSFNKIRQSLETPQGTNGDLGLDIINGYTTSFTQGLTAPAELYRLTLQAIGPGTADLSIWPADEPKFDDSTPCGLKVGHTDYNGDPNVAYYPDSIAMTVFSKADLDENGDVDFTDFAILAGQWLQAPHNPSADIAPDGGDNMVNFLDLNVFSENWLENGGI
jgi:hypothetical protein